MSCFFHYIIISFEVLLNLPTPRSVRNAYQLNIAFLQSHLLKMIAKTFFLCFEKQIRLWANSHLLLEVCLLQEGFRRGSKNAGVSLFFPEVKGLAG